MNCPGTKTYVMCLSQDYDHKIHCYSNIHKFMKGDRLYLKQTLF